GSATTRYGFKMPGCALSRLIGRAYGRSSGRSHNADSGPDGSSTVQCAPARSVLYTMPPPRNDLPPPSPATIAVNPEPSRTSWAIHGSHATGRRVAVTVSPSRMPRRSPTSAVAVGTAAAAHTTEPRRLYALDAIGSPGMNSLAIAYCASGCSIAIFGLYNSSNCWA